VCRSQVTTNLARTEGDGRVGGVWEMGGGKERYRWHMAVCVPHSTAVQQSVQGGRHQYYMCHVPCLVPQRLTYEHNILKLCLFWDDTACSLTVTCSQQGPPKRCYLSTKLHGVNAQNTIS
jgi:hypothetical protein